MNAILRQEEYKKKIRKKMSEKQVYRDHDPNETGKNSASVHEFIHVHNAHAQCRLGETQTIIKMHEHHRQQQQQPQQNMVINLRANQK